LHDQPTSIKPDAIFDVHSPGCSQPIDGHHVVNSQDVSFNGRMMTAFRMMCRTHGGPQQYLQKVMGSEATQQSFLAYIMTTCPMKQDLEYVENHPLPRATRD
jgi:hypothetical protein